MSVLGEAYNSADDPADDIDLRSGLRWVPIFLRSLDALSIISCAS